MRMIKQKIDQDLKTAMLAGDKALVSVLRGMKSAILYAEVSEGKREVGLEEGTLITLLQKESKKRQEAAALYEQGGNTEKQTSELYEKRVIDSYLPQALSEEEVSAVVEAVIEELGDVTQKDMGQIIGKVKARTAGAADGAIIAQLVKAKLN